MLLQAQPVAKEGETTLVLAGVNFQMHLHQLHLENLLLGLKEQEEDVLNVQHHLKDIRGQEMLVLDVTPTL